MAIARIKTYDDLLAYLKEHNVPHKADPANLTVELPVPSAVDGPPVFVRWEKALPYVQVIFPFIGNVPDARVPELESAICRVNNTIKLPGFGYAHDTHVLYMRLCVQLYDDGVAVTSFQRQVLGVIENAKDFFAAFRDVVAGAPGKDVLALAVNNSQRPQ